MATPSRRLPLVLAAVVIAALAWSGVGPYDRLTWWLEVLPVLVALPLLAATARRFPLTPLVYRLIALHCLVLILGARYTYARVPLGFWMQDWFDFSRNHYDRIGHLMQGFGPAMVARELLLRTSPLRRGKWLFAIVTLSVLGMSAFYEFAEWWAALAGGAASDAFLGTPRAIGAARIAMGRLGLPRLQVSEAVERPVCEVLRLLALQVLVPAG